jgi:hypothetical protein
LWIGFFADGKLKKVFVRGGGAVTITEASQPFGAAWLPDGVIVFAPSAAGGLIRVNENGGPAVILTTPSAAAGELSHAYPSPGPGGNGVIFVVRTSPLPDAPGRLALLPHARSRQTAWRVLVDRVNVGGAVGTEFLAFIRDGGLSAVGYDFLRQTASGAPHVIEGSIMSPHLALSPSGSMATVGVKSIEPSTPGPPTWSWNLVGPTAPEWLPSLHQASLSPNARHLAGVDTQSLTDIWVVDLERSTRVRLTYNAVNTNPVWSADSSTVFYASRRQGEFEIWSRKIGGDETKVLSKPDRHLFPSSLAGDGSIAFAETGGATRSDVGIHHRGTSGTQMIAQTPFDEVAPAISPDATMLAYQSDESGQWEITVVRLSDGRRQVVSRGGGARPFWSHDGRLLHFEQTGTLMTVAIDPSQDGAGAPIAVSRLNGASPVGIAPSGAVLLHRAVDPHLRLDSAALTLNWIQQLRRTLLPPLPTTPR